MVVGNSYVPTHPVVPSHTVQHGHVDMVQSTHPGNFQSSTLSARARKIEVVKRGDGGGGSTGCYRGLPFLKSARARIVPCTCPFYLKFTSLYGLPTFRL